MLSILRRGDSLTCREAAGVANHTPPPSPLLPHLYCNYMHSFTCLALLWRVQVSCVAFVGGTPNGTSTFVTGGPGHLTFWVVCGSMLTPYSGVFGKKPKVCVHCDAACVIMCTVSIVTIRWTLGAPPMQSHKITSAAVCGHKLVTGAGNGSLYVWRDRAVTNVYTGGPGSMLQEVARIP